VVLLVNASSINFQVEEAKKEGEAVIVGWASSLSQ
jgi:hypothetical protein